MMVNSMWLGIKNYQPDFCELTNQLIEKHRKKLLILKGDQIKKVFILWNNTEDEWCKVAPIVLTTKTTQIELCANKINEYSITYDTIVLSEEIEPSDMGDGEIWHYEWRLYTQGDYTNSKIIDAEIIELLFKTTTIHDKDNPENNGNEYEDWLLHGVGFELDSGYICFYNEFDSNGIELFKEKREEIRYITLNLFEEGKASANNHIHASGIRPRSGRR
ncbi:hypothetical protein [Paenibacillus sp. 2TAB19]|uniref:hypothetical protein n=1 Tax=Paenibacillus sp. 2TAB19 TaxID=3233003 RepID=UPI003F965837